jgi:hypothetical protein
MKYTEGKTKLRSHNTSYCLVKVITKTGLTMCIAIGDPFIKRGWGWDPINQDNNATCFACPKLGFPTSCVGGLFDVH